MISPSRIKRLKVQGYTDYSDNEISDFAFGNRFAFIVCGSIVAVGVAMADIRILASMAIVAFGGLVLTYHPFDYIYNHLLSKSLNKPKIPPRSKQLKFTCFIATIWLLATIYLFYSGYMTSGYIAGILLVIVATIVSTMDYCIPSTIYNTIFKIKVD